MTLNIHETSELMTYFRQRRGSSCNQDTEITMSEFLLEDSAAALIQAFAESECYSTEYRNPSPTGKQE